MSLIGFQFEKRAFAVDVKVKLPAFPKIMSLIGFQFEKRAFAVDVKVKLPAFPHFLR